MRFLTFDDIIGIYFSKVCKWKKGGKVVNVIFEFVKFILEILLNMITTVSGRIFSHLWK